MKSKISWGTWGSWRHAQIFLRMWMKSFYSELLKKRNGAEQMPGIRALNNWSWYVYPPQLITQLWKTMCVKYSVKLGLKSVRRIYSLAIDLKRKTFKRFSNLVIGRTLWKSCEGSKSFLILNLLRELDNFYNLILEISNDTFVSLSYANLWVMLSYA